ncbi:MAG: LysE/ArgO family amino acid transporter [Pseudomonadota bacterium]
MTIAAAAGTGFLAALSLILAIGAQNAFVLRQGLMRAHVFWICLTCAASDALLITAGVLGFGALTQTIPWFPKAMLYGGAAFLVVYGLLRFWSAYQGNTGLETNQEAQPLWPALLTCLTLTWLNPHVYLDTLALIGALSTQFLGSAKLAFGLGAVTASFVFFFTLGYGARMLRPIMQTPRSWRILDLGIGVLMWALAAGLLLADHGI